MKNTRAVRYAALVLCASAALAACSSGGKSDSTTTGGSSAAAASGSNSGSTAATVSIKSFKFTFPDSVKPGQSLTVKNEDSVAHTVTSGSLFDVKVAANGTATMTAPAKAGSYDITCDYHPNMHGTLVVGS